MSLPRVLKQPAAVRPVVFGGIGGDGEPGPPLPSPTPPPLAVLKGTAAPLAGGPAMPAPPRRVFGRESVVTSREPVRIQGPVVNRPLAAPSPAAPPPPSPEALRAEAEARARAEREAAVEAARAEAFAAGHAAGRAEAEAELKADVEALRASVGGDIERLERAWLGHHERVERQLVALALEAADLLTAGPLSDAAREATDRAVVQAVEGIGRGDGLNVRVHPVDFLRLQEGGIVDGLAAAHPGLRWTPDDACAEGDWVVESPEAAVRRVRAELLDGLRARLDLLQAAQDAPPAGGHRVELAPAPAATSAEPAPTTLLATSPSEGRDEA